MRLTASRTYALLHSAAILVVVIPAPAFADCRARIAVLDRDISEYMQTMWASPPEAEERVYLSERAPYGEEEALSAEDPLIVQMEDGRTLDLRPKQENAAGLARGDGDPDLPDIALAKPVENWFGHPPTMQHLRVDLEAARAALAAGNEAECLEAVRHAYEFIERYQIEPLIPTAPAAGN